MATDWWAVSTDRGRFEQAAKPAVMFALIAMVSAGDFDIESVRPWVLAGLALGLVGDVLLLPRFDRFIAGLVSFLAGHLAYVVAFVLLWEASPAIAVGIGGLVLLIARFAIPIDRNLRGSTLRPAVAAYIAVTGAVLVSGAATGRWLIILGTVAFACSDGLLGENRFVRPAPERRWIVHALYQLGQAAIVIGAITA